MTRTAISLATFLCLFFTTTFTFAQTFDEDKFIIQFDNTMSGAQISAFLDEYNLMIVDGPTPELGFYLLQIDPDLGWPPNIEYNNYTSPILGVIVTTGAAGGVSSAGFNHHTTVIEDSNLEGSHSEAGLNPLLNCPSAFSTSIPAYGESSVQASIFDTGISSSNLFGDFIDPLDLGENFIGTGEPLDDNGHGTHVTSTIVLPFLDDFFADIQIYSYKTHDFAGSSTVWNLIEAVDRVIAEEIEVVNMSLGYVEGYKHRLNVNAPLKVAIDAAEQMVGTLFIVAAGNDGIDNDDPNDFSHYPASFNCENTIAVSAVDCSYDTPSWSNFGAESVDIAAPGVGIWGINHLGEFVQMNGTSSAATFVTRAAILLGSYQPVFDYQEIKCCILTGATEASSLDNVVYCGGYLNVQGAFNELMSPLTCGVGSDYVPGPSTSKDGNMISAEIDIQMNPSDDRAINIVSAVEEEVTISIFNVMGQLLSSEKVTLNQADNPYEMPIDLQSNLAVYFVHIYYGNKSKTFKIIK